MLTETLFDSSFCQFDVELAGFVIIYCHMCFVDNACSKAGVVDNFGSL